MNLNKHRRTQLITWLFLIIFILGFVVLFGHISYADEVELINSTTFVSLDQIGYEMSEYDTFADMYDARDNISSYFTKDELELLASTVWGESGDETYSSQIWTAKVLLNRIESKYFPDTVEGVVYQGGGRQFNAVWRSNFGYYTEDSYNAVIVAFNNTTITKDIVYFANVKLSSDSKFIKNVIIPNTVEIDGGHNYAFDDRIRKDLAKQEVKDGK